MKIIKYGYFPNSYSQKLLYSSGGYLKIAHQINGRWLVFEKEMDFPINRAYFLNKFVEILVK